MNNDQYFKKILNLIIFISFLTVLPVFASAEDNDDNYIFADADAPNGGDGSRNLPYNNFQDVLNSLRNFSEKRTVEIAGTFFGQIVVDSSIAGTEEQPIIFKQWEGKKQGTFDCIGLNVTFCFQLDRTQNITIDGLHFQNAHAIPEGGLPLISLFSKNIKIENVHASAGGESNICVRGSDGVKINNVVSEGGDRMGILIPMESKNIEVTNSLVQNNALYERSGGINVENSTNVLLKNNIIRDNLFDGIKVYNASAVTIENNEILFNKRGIEFSSNTNPGENNFLNNQIIGNEIGIYYQAFGQPDATNIVGNVIAENTLAGFELWETADREFSMNLINNTFLNNRTGILIDNNRQLSLNLFNNIVMGHDIGADINTSDINKIRSNNNNFKNNADILIYHKGPFGPYDWERWQNQEGLDRRSLSQDPAFSVETTCFDRQDSDPLCVNFHLSPLSPVIDMGKHIAGLPNDMDGHLRPEEENDIGADEYNPVRVVGTSQVAQ